MKLSELDIFDNITIQCHDNPDPDALASAFALYRYFKGKGKNVCIIYSGKFKIRKSNLMLMIKELEIPVTYYPADKGRIPSDCRLSVRTGQCHPDRGRRYCGD